jgi:acetyl esterase/lipase
MTYVADRRRVPYGEHARQYIEVFGSAGPPTTAILLVHGGFWRAEKDAARLATVCQDFASRGVLAGSIEYRTVEYGGTWPHCFADVSRAVSAFHAATGIPPGKTLLAGHSAGGHLALMTAATQPKLGGVVGLAAISDLIDAHRSRLGADAVLELLGETRCQEPLLLRASPAHLAPPRCRVLLIHGDADTTVPFHQSERYCSEALRKHCCARLLRIPEATHMHIVKPTNRCWPVVRREILRFAWGNLTSELSNSEGECRPCQLAPAMPGVCQLENGDGQAFCRADTPPSCRRQVSAGLKPTRRTRSC